MREPSVYQTPGQIPASDLITGERIVLRPITFADTENILRWRNSPGVRDHFVFRETMTKQMHERWLNEEVGTGRVVQWILCEKTGADARPFGSVYLRDIDNEKHCAEYGIYIGEPDARGKGYAVEAARLVLRYAFDTLGLATVGLRVFADNEQAKKGYLAAGFCPVRGLKSPACTGDAADMLWMEATPGI